MKTKYKTLKPYLMLWSTQSLSSLGSGKGAGAAMLFGVIGVVGVLVCYFG